MSKQENNEELPDKTVSYVYIPDEDIYGTLVAQNSYYSIVEYFDNGVGYHIEVDNEDFIIVDEFGITYIDDLEEYQDEEMEEDL
jgi:hypothetical protein